MKDADLVVHNALKGRYTTTGVFILFLWSSASVQTQWSAWLHKFGSFVNRPQNKAAKLLSVGQIGASVCRLRSYREHRYSCEECWKSVGSRRSKDQNCRDKKAYRPILYVGIWSLWPLFLVRDSQENCTGSQFICALYAVSAKLHCTCPREDILVRLLSITNKGNHHVNCVENCCFRIPVSIAAFMRSPNLERDLSTCFVEPCRLRAMTCMTSASRCKRQLTSCLVVYIDGFCLDVTLQVMHWPGVSSQFITSTFWEYFRSGRYENLQQRSLAKVLTTVWTTICRAHGLQ